MFEDKTLVCKDCGKEFVWTAGEQEFYASRGFENQPQRCKPCRDARKNGGARSNGGERQMFDAVCAACGKACKVPFQPREDRPVYCSDCFARMLCTAKSSGLHLLLHPLHLQIPASSSLPLFH